MPPRVNVVCSVSRYWLEDMVVVQVCCRFSRTILVVRAGGFPAARPAPHGPGGGRHGCGLQKLAAVHFSLLAATSSLLQ